MAKIYTSDQVNYSIGGVMAPTGRDPDEFIKVEPMAEAFTEVVGADGEVSRARSNDRRAKVTITLWQTGEANGFLSALHNADLNAPNGAGVGAFLLEDLSGFTVVAGDACWIKKFPEVSYGSEIKKRVWEITVANAIWFVGGN